MPITTWKGLFIGLLILSCRLSYGDDADIKLTTSNGGTKFTVQNSGGAEVASINSLGGLTVSSNTVLPGTTFYQNGAVDMGVSGQSVDVVPKLTAALFIGTAASPTCGLGTGAGSGATSCTVTGTIFAGNVSVTTAGTPTASQTVFTLTNAIAVPGKYACVISCGNQNCETNAVAKKPWFDRSKATTTAWSITAGTTGLSATTYIWNYVCGAY